MTVLVIGCQDLARVLDAEGARVELLAGPGVASERIAREPDSIALVLARERERSCLEPMLRDAVAAAGSVVPILFIREPGEGQATGPPPTCAVEETADGRRLLRCALQEARARPDARPGLTRVLDTHALVFSFSAPVRRGRG